MGDFGENGVVYTECVDLDSLRRYADLGVGRAQVQLLCYVRRVETDGAIHASGLRTLQQLYRK